MIHHQLTDPAQICENAVWHLGDSRGIGGTLGLAAFGSPCPFRDVARCEPGVWHAFCRATSVVEELIRQRGKDWTWGAIWRTDTDREVLLREAAAWLRSDDAQDMWVDNELAVQEYYPGHYRGIIKDPTLSYLGPFIKDNPDDAIEDARRLMQKVRDREAFEAGDDRFEEVHSRVCGTSFSEVRRKDLKGDGEIDLLMREEK